MEDLAGLIAFHVQTLNRVQTREVWFLSTRIMRTLNLKWVGLTALVIALAACQNDTPTTTQTGGAAAATTPGAGTALGTRTAQRGNAAASTALPTRVVVASTNIAVDGALALGRPLIAAAFEASGNISTIRVVPGQAVKKGEVLAELDGAGLNQTLALAQEQLTLKQAEIDNSSASTTTAADIASAKASLASAQAAYDALQKGASPHDVEQAKISWNTAKNSLYSTQLNRDAVCGLAPGKSTMEDFQHALSSNRECKHADIDTQASELRVATALQQYQDAQLPATEAELAQSYASLAQAKASLSTLQKGISADQKKSYALQIAQAQLAVDRAQRDLSQAKLLSPCDCVVQAVSLSVGGNATGNISLLDTSLLRFQTSNLNERDVVNLKTGQAVIIRLKAFEQTFNGKVKTILPISTGTDNGVALYTVIINVDPADVTLLPGMTGQAEIQLQ